MQELEDILKIITTNICFYNNKKCLYYTKERFKGKIHDVFGNKAENIIDKMSHLSFLQTLL